MGTGASELQQKGHEEPVINVLKKPYPNERDLSRSGQRDEIRRRNKQKTQVVSKDIANIFNLPPLPATDEGPYPDAEYDPNLRISSDSDDSLVVRVSVSPGELKKRKKDVSLSNLSLDDGPNCKELDSLTSEIDVALEGHDEVMKDIRGVYFIHNVTSRGSADLPLTKSGSNCNTVVRPKGSTIEPLPGMIPVRVNWSASEKLTEQEKILYQKLKSMKVIEESVPQTHEGIRSDEIDGQTRESSKERKPSPDEEEFSEPKPIIIRFDYTEEELELMRSIEREYGDRYQTMY